MSNKDEENNQNSYQLMLTSTYQYRNPHRILKAKLFQVFLSHHKVDTVQSIQLSICHCAM